MGILFEQVLFLFPHSVLPCSRNMKLLSAAVFAFGAILMFAELGDGCHVSGHWMGGYSGDQGSENTFRELSLGSSIGSNVGTGPLVGSYFVGPEIAMEITDIGRPGPMQMVFRKEKFTEELKSFGLSDRVVACTLAKEEEIHSLRMRKKRAISYNPFRVAAPDFYVFGSEKPRAFGVTG